MLTRIEGRRAMGPFLLRQATVLEVADGTVVVDGQRDRVYRLSGARVGRWTVFGTSI